MKPGTQSQDDHGVIQDRTTGGTFLTWSTATPDRTITWENGQTYPIVSVDVTTASHPYRTGGRLLDSAGRVEKFRRRYGDGR